MTQLAKTVPLLAVLLALVPCRTGLGQGEDGVSFSRDVLPVLSEHCFACHGPDEAAREAELRLDHREDALLAHEDGAGIVPGDAAASRIIVRMKAEDPDDRMPPPETKKAPTAEQIAILERWIAEGAPYEGHWAFSPPARPEPPEVSREEWRASPIDRFILARIEAAGLAPSPEADRRTLARRASFDLRGLPPSPEELAEFLADESPDAFARLVDRFLASPHYGERMAVPWLDAARYADTNGYHHDYFRAMWPWRDWVIGAFNENLPYDRFVVEQLAGDLLPDATRAQKIASGFNRNHMVNNEGGAIPEEYQVEYVVDRVRTTSSVFMGLTMACAQCHDHKYDPISQEEYYRFYDFFNRVPETGLDGDPMAPKPSLAVPDANEEAALAAAEAELAAARAALDAPQPELDAKQRAWEDAMRAELAWRWSALHPQAARSTGGATFEIEADGTLLAGGENPGVATYAIELETELTGLRALWLEVMMDPRIPGGGPARNSHGNFVLSEFRATAVSKEDPTKRVPVTFGRAIADYSQDRYEIPKAIDGNPGTGWAVDGHKRRANRSAVFLAKEPFGFPGGTILEIEIEQNYGGEHTLGRFRLHATGDASRRAELAASELGDWSMIGPFPGLEGLPLRRDFGPESDLAGEGEHGGLGWRPRPDFADGALHGFAGADEAIGTTYLRRVIRCETERTMRVAIGSDDAVALFVNGRRVFLNDVRRPLAKDQDLVELALAAGENVLLMKIVNHGGSAGMFFERRAEYPTVLPGDVTRALATPAEAREARLEKALRDHFRTSEYAPWARMLDRVSRAEDEAAGLRSRLTRVMVMQDRPGMRMTHVLERGVYSAKGAPVTAGTPRALPPLPEVESPNRLDLARWLVRPDHPLTARVWVNRVWSILFGRGLVETVEDFGTQGTPPTHPELLDWLAADFVEHGWDTKRLVRQIVLSRTWRQSARVRPELHEADPKNELLARAPRYRLTAEFVRDNALAISGLLVEDVGGQSVKPYQPPGLWAEMTFAAGQKDEDDFFRRDEGDALWRRGLYTYWKRSCPPPQLQTFDAPTREVCTLRRARTNTPLQALVLLNDETYLEAARAFAERLLAPEGQSDAERLARGFEIAVARRPNAREAERIAAILDDQRQRFADRAEDASKILAHGASPRRMDLEPREHAAWTLVASVLLNLDETMTRR
ncbi:MAG: PSD1 and planctomycete cytochrome C domain-containing protein [Planctomycetota bacterium]